MRSYVFMLLAFIMVSCHSGDVLNTLDTDFPDNRWNVETPKTFSFTIEKEGRYDIFVRFSHVAGFQFREVPLTLSVSSPNAPIDLYEQSLEVVDANGTDKGDCSGDICDLEQVFASHIKLAPGTYTAALTQRFPNAYLPNILGVGLRVTPSTSH
ncbi:gliding motility lipoprotein GldH [Flavobacterium sp. HJ-32-4]|uniref:gliding motility lipoprotein GldH n=1 Tax=Flavobacterium sp. HJ-32-4 TaxID=1160795 RepID=UPI001F12E27B|nr:gliding motility lipoprotein GldH [Flavobacterium sp. HJ-32-4]UMY66542.1 gliding motility lipoprotein GldH [Flavobacterium sp. HJ-32-4]